MTKGWAVQVGKTGFVEVMVNNQVAQLVTPVRMNIAKWREMNAEVEAKAATAGFKGDEATEVSMPTDIIRIVTGLDSDGNACWSTVFKKAGPDSYLIDLITGLGMLEAAKMEFVSRHKFFEE